MRNADKLRKFMRWGRVYRRQDIEDVSTAVDRDLKTLLDRGEVRKLARGLYCRTGRNPFGVAVPGENELVRAFLKSDDFLLTSYNDFTQLGLGLTQLYNHRIVYNHKRSGEFSLGGQRFRFRVVRAYPKSLSKEYLLIDLLNHAKKLPDDTGRAIANLSSHLHEFDREKLSACLDRYGTAQAKNVLRGMLKRQPEEFAHSGGVSVVRDRMPLRVVSKEGPCDDLEFWLAKSPAERVAAVEFLREQYYAISGCKSLPRLAHSIQMRNLHE